MRFPYRPQKPPSTPALPSILTLFPADHDHQISRASSREQANSHQGAAHGLEVVPIERCNTSCGKTVSPDTEEKEVLHAAIESRNRRSKPLPPLPKAAWKALAKAKWYRLPVKRRMGVLLCIQFCMLLIVCLSLLSIKPREREIAKPADGVKPSSNPLGPTFPIGSFTLKLATPLQQSTACLTDSDDADAWACTSEAVLSIGISPPTGPSKQQTLSIRSANQTEQSGYGEQTIAVTTAESISAHAQEQPEENLHHFRAFYNRTVLLAEAQLSFSRPAQQGPEGQTKSTVSPEENPWLCYFNNSIIDIVIYTSQHATTVTNGTQGSDYNTTRSHTGANFPFVVQISEKWNPNGMRAYCEQQKVSEHNRMRTNDAPKYFLNTSDAGKAYDSAIESSTKPQAGLVESTCQCQWKVQ